MDAAGAGRVSGKGLTLPALGEVLFAVHLHTVQCLSRGGCCGVFAAPGTLLLSPTSAGHAGPRGGRASRHSVPRDGRGCGQDSRHLRLLLCVCAEGPAAPGRAVNRPACLHNAGVAMGEVRGPGDVRAWRGGVWGGGPCPAPC